MASFESMFGDLEKEIDNTRNPEGMPNKLTNLGDNRVSPSVRFYRLKISNIQNMDNENPSDSYVPNVEISVNKYNKWLETNARFYNLSQIPETKNLSYVKVSHTHEKKISKPGFVSKVRAASVTNDCKKIDKSVAVDLKLKNALMTSDIFGIKSSKDVDMHRLLRKAMVHHRCFRKGTRFEF